MNFLYFELDIIGRKVSTEASNSFDDKMDDISKRLLFAKIACLTIAQHNMFRSEKIEDDAKYGDELKKLHSKSDFRISMDTPLLMLLSLVDTFECIKRFGKTENERDYLQKNTILESIMLNVTTDCIVIDYIRLSNRIEKKDNSLQEEFSKYLNGLCSISKWTMFLVGMEKDRIITIRFIT